MNLDNCLFTVNSGCCSNHHSDMWMKQLPGTQFDLIMLCMPKKNTIRVTSYYLVDTGIPNSLKSRNTIIQNVILFSSKATLFKF